MWEDVGRILSEPVSADAWASAHCCIFWFENFAILIYIVIFGLITVYFFHYIPRHIGGGLICYSPGEAVAVTPDFIEGL